MGLYKSASDQPFPDSLSRVALAKTYTMYCRAGVWYVNFRAEGAQKRVSTGLRDFAQAKTAVELAREKWLPDAARPVDDQHLYRMIERARYKMRKKGVPVQLGIAYLREVAARCGGYCEVSGRRLEDAGPFRPSLDRIEPKLGYVPGNVRIVCLVTNTAMLHYGEEAFAEIAIAYCAKRDLLAT